MPGLIAIVIAYLLGGIPFGFLLVKLTRGTDVRESGSGNIGATNVLRTTGRAAGLATLALDIAKGFVAVWLAAKLTDDAPEWTSLAALAVMAETTPFYRISKPASAAKPWRLSSGPSHILRPFRWLPCCCCS